MGQSNQADDSDQYISPYETGSVLCRIVLWVDSGQ